MSPSQVFAFALASSGGALARWSLVELLQDVWPDLPWPTAVVNVLGCFGFGACWALADGRWSPALAAIVLAGFFGAFTTFSSFVFDCHRLLADGRFGLMFANVLGQNVLGLVALAGGAAAGMRFVR